MEGIPFIYSWLRVCSLKDIGGFAMLGVISSILLSQLIWPIDMPKRKSVWKILCGPPKEKEHLIVPPDMLLLFR